jgi:hypothetical protein
LPPTTFDKMMEDMKSFFNDLIKHILMKMNLPAAEVDKAAASMQYAFGSLDYDTFAKVMAAGFAGGADLATIEQFISTSFNFPDFKPVSEAIIDKVETYLKKNTVVLPAPYDQKNNDALIKDVLNEFKKPRGPDFYNLPKYLTNYGVPKAAADESMK